MASDDARLLAREIAKGRKRDRQTVQKPATVLHSDADGTTWVHIPGGADATPCTGSTVEAKPGDSVLVTIGNGRATITGNKSDKAVGRKTLRNDIAAAMQGIAGGKMTGEIEGPNGEKYVTESELKQTASEIEASVTNKTLDRQAVVDITSQQISSWVSASGGSSKYVQTESGFVWQVDAPISAEDSTARTDASAAKTDAESAKTAADSADAKAGNAQKAAEDAQTAADDAATKATNYLYFQSEQGLRMASEDPENATSYTQMSSTDFSVVSEGKTVAKFGDTITLGETSGYYARSNMEIDSSGLTINSNYRTSEGYENMSASLYFTQESMNSDPVFTIDADTVKISDNSFVQVFTLSGGYTVSGNATKKVTLDDGYIPAEYTMVGIVRSATGNSGVGVTTMNPNGNSSSGPYVYVHNFRSSSESGTASLDVACIHAS